MKLIKCYTAFRSVCEMMTYKEEYELAHALYTAKLALMPHAQFYAQSETELITKYAGSNCDGIKITDFVKKLLEAGTYKEYKAEHEKLDMIEVEIKKAALKKPFREMTGNQRESLEEVFDFPEDVR